MQDLWTEKNGSFPGYNCRITAFSLFGEFVTAGVDQPETQGEDSSLWILKRWPQIPPFSAETARPSSAHCLHRNCRRYHGGGGSGQSASGGLVGRGISFEDSSARLISVVLHDRFSDTDNTLFIGHVGVLLPAEDGSLYFIERLPFQEPYRLVKIQNRTELSDYLMEKYDTAWGQDTTRSFIMENDNLWMDTAQTRWTARHKQQYRQEACFFAGGSVGRAFFRLCAVSSLPRSGYSQSLSLRHCGRPLSVYNKCRAHSASPLPITERFR